MIDFRFPVAVGEWPKPAKRGSAIQASGTGPVTTLAGLTGNDRQRRFKSCRRLESYS